MPRYHKEFFERLYRGFEAEHFIAGRLFSLGYEAFIPPADFGFDLIVTNLKEQSMGPRRRGRRLDPPFALQIKSRRLLPSDFRVGASGRDQAEVSIPIKKEDLDLLMDTDHAFLIVVLFIQEADEWAGDRTVSFWFHSSHIRSLFDLGYFHPSEEDRRVRELLCSLRGFPMLDVRELLDALVSQRLLTRRGRERLLSELPGKVPKNWKASEYIALARKARNRSENLIWRKVPEELCNLANLGFDVELRDLLG